VYQLPSDCLRVLRQDGDYDFKIFGNKVYSNESTCKIQYISKITDSAEFPIYFVNALAAQIAAVLAYGITQNATLSETMMKLAAVALKEAIYTDAQESVGIKPITGSFITARQTGSV